MSIYFENGGEMVVLIAMDRDPYDAAEAESFYATYDALLAYANRRLRVVSRGPLTMLTDDRDILDRTAQVSERLWRSPWLIDDFVAQNPADLTGAQLEDAALWRHAVRDAFHVVNAEEDHVLLMNGDRIFCACGLQAPADKCIRAVPCSLIATLLPFRGGIVTDGKVMHLWDDFEDDDIKEIADAARSLTRRGIISSSYDLVSYAKKTARENRLSDELQELLDEALGLEPTAGSPRRAATA